MALKRCKAARNGCAKRPSDCRGRMCITAVAPSCRAVEAQPRARADRSSRQPEVYRASGSWAEPPRDRLRDHVAGSSPSCSDIVSAMSRSGDFNDLQETKIGRAMAAGVLDRLRGCEASVAAGGGRERGHIIGGGPSEGR